MDSEKLNQASDGKTENVVSNSFEVSKETNFVPTQFRSDVKNCLNQLVVYESQAKRLCFQDLRNSNDMQVEKLLRQAKDKYISELSDFSSQTACLYQTIEKKNNLKKELYNSIDKIIAGLKTHLEACSNIVPALNGIHETLVNQDLNRAIHYRECVNLFTEFVNRAVENYGYGDSFGPIKKVDCSEHRNVNDIARDCIQTMGLLKENGPVNPYADKIAKNKQVLEELNLVESELIAKNEESKCEKEQLDIEQAALEEQVAVVEKELEESIKEAIIQDEEEKEKMVKLVFANMEKTTQLINMGKKMEEMKMKLAELPQIEMVYADLKEQVEKLEEKHVATEARIEEIKTSINTKQSHIEELRRKQEKMEKEHARELDEIYNNIGNAEIQLRDKQAKLKGDKKNLEIARVNLEEKQHHLNLIEKEYQDAKNAVRQKKIEKKANLREKRKVLVKLDQEIFMLSFKLGLPC